MYAELSFVAQAGASLYPVKPINFERGQRTLIIRFRVGLGVRYGVIKITIGQRRGDGGDEELPKFRPGTGEIGPRENVRYPEG